MKFEEFIKISRYIPVIDTEIFMTGVTDSAGMKVQISRWEKAGKLIQLRRGIYLLAEEYRKIRVYEPYIASLLKKPSYISLEKALEYHGLIPEAVPVYTSVTTKRPGKIVTKLGVFDYRHIKSSLFWGYDSVAIDKQTAFIASPEKALLDFFYLKPVKVSVDYLEEMRLQSMDKINMDKLAGYAKKFGKPAAINVFKVIQKYASDYLKQEKEL